MPDTTLYTDLSAYYDLMCSDINYIEQCDTAHRLHRIFGNKGLQYLDLACGTGPHVERFIELGYNCTGLDINEPMLQRAAERCEQATFSLQDMSSFQFQQPFDLITCFLYSIHYCYPQNKFNAVLSNVFNALNPGGVFCFDSVDKHTISNDEGVKHRVQNGEEYCSFQSRWYYSGAGDILDLHLSICRYMNKRQQVWHDHHTMLALDIHTLQALLTDIGFIVTIFERDFLKLVPWNEKAAMFFLFVLKLFENYSEKFQPNIIFNIKKKYIKQYF